MSDQPASVTESPGGRTFVGLPRPGAFTVGEIRDGDTVAYPDEAWNSPSGDDDPKAFVSVRRVLATPFDRLWVLDTGSPEFRETEFGGPKLVCVNLDNDTAERTIVFDPATALPTSYLYDVVFDAERNAAFILDAPPTGPGGLVVLDLDSGTAWRRLHDHPSTARGAASSPGGLELAGDQLRYCPPGSDQWHSVELAELCDRENDHISVDGEPAALR